MGLDDGLSDSQVEFEDSTRLGRSIAEFHSADTEDVVLGGFDRFSSFTRFDVDAQVLLDSGLSLDLFEDGSQRDKLGVDDVVSVFKLVLFPEWSL